MTIYDPIEKAAKTGDRGAHYRRIGAGGLQCVSNFYSVDEHV